MDEGSDHHHVDSRSGISVGYSNSNYSSEIREWPDYDGFLYLLGDHVAVAWPFHGISRVWYGDRDLVCAPNANILIFVGLAVDTVDGVAEHVWLDYEVVALRYAVCGIVLVYSVYGER